MTQLLVFIAITLTVWLGLRFIYRRRPKRKKSIYPTVAKLQETIEKIPVKKVNYPKPQIISGRERARKNKEKRDALLQQSIQQSIDEEYERGLKRLADKKADKPGIDGETIKITLHESWEQKAQVSKENFSSSETEIDIDEGYQTTDKSEGGVN